MSNRSPVFRVDSQAPAGGSILRITADALEFIQRGPAMDSCFLESSRVELVAAVQDVVDPLDGPSAKLPKSTRWVLSLRMASQFAAMQLDFKQMENLSVARGWRELLAAPGSRERFALARQPSHRCAHHDRKFAFRVFRWAPAALEACIDASENSELSEPAVRVLEGRIGEALDLLLLCGAFAPRSQGREPIYPAALCRRLVRLSRLSEPVSEAQARSFIFGE